jgi:NAD+ diphosphatase
MYTPADFTPGHALPASVPGHALAFAFDDARLLVIEEQAGPRVPTFAEVRALVPGARLHFLGELAGCGCVALALDHATVLPPGFATTGLRPLFFRLPDPLVALAARAFQVVEFAGTHRFCGRCGTPLLDRPGERARQCPSCGLVAYPRVSPAMMARVIRGR